MKDPFEVLDLFHQTQDDDFIGRLPSRFQSIRYRTTERKDGHMQSSVLFKSWGTFNKGMNAKSMLLSFANHLEYSLSKDRYTATQRDMYQALALAVRDRMVERWIHTQQNYYLQDVKRVYCLSAEYLMGRVLVNNLVNLGIYEEARKAMEEIHLDLNDLAEQEPDMGLGNGGIGRLAACFLDSLATLEIPAYGYGIRYEFGIFDQAIKNLEQFELLENWLRFGNPWGNFQARIHLQRPFLRPCQTDDRFRRPVEIGMDRHEQLMDRIQYADPFMVLADFSAYCKAQQTIDEWYGNADTWVQKSIVNVARIGKFSSDRTIREYNEDIWKATPLHITRESS